MHIISCACEFNFAWAGFHLVGRGWGGGERVGVGGSGFPSALPPPQNIQLSGSLFCPPKMKRKEEGEREREREREGEGGYVYRCI